MIRVCWGLGSCAGATVGGNHSTRGKDRGRAGMVWRTCSNRYHLLMPAVRTGMVWWCNDQIVGLCADSRLLTDA